jgi:hypothetical protein
MSRRFVNLVVKKLSSIRPVFNLHRIDPAGLFHPAGSPKLADAAAAVHKCPDPGRLPPAAISFPLNKAEWMRIYFMALNKDVVIAVDHMGRTVAYDAALGTVRSMNATQRPDWSPISITVGNGLYTLSIHHRPPPIGNSFQVLSYGRPLGYCWPEDWNWRPLQPPPLEYHKYVHNYLEAPHHPCAIRAWAVVRDSQIWISTEGAGTYSFDTQTGTWSNAGDWSMPFRGHAEYAPEHGLWFALSDGDARLCAVSVADLELTPTVCRNLWVDDTPVPEGWIPTVSRILPLGSAKFCLVRLSQKDQRGKTVQQLWRSKVQTCVVLAGLEVLKHDDAAALHIVKHKSKTYRFRGDEVELL